MCVGAGPLVMQLLCKLKLTSVREIMISCSGVRVIPDFPQKGIDTFNLLSFFLQEKRKRQTVPPFKDIHFDHT